MLWDAKSHYLLILPNAMDVLSGAIVLDAQLLFLKDNKMDVNQLITLSEAMHFMEKQPFNHTLKDQCCLNSFVKELDQLDLPAYMRMENPKLFRRS